MKNWFKRKTVNIHELIFEECEKIANKYGAKVSYVGVDMHYYEHIEDTGLNVWVHTLNYNKPLQVSFDKEIDIKEVLEKYEASLILGNFKNK